MFSAHMVVGLLLLISFLVSETSCTTEWWGDLRAQFNPPKFPPFYDVTYDDTEVCPVGVRSMAIPEYVYFGEMIATKRVTRHTECVLECLITDGCRAVNYFAPLSLASNRGTKNESGFCEILGEDQRDNPILMRPFHKAIYYEQIRCIADDDQSSSAKEEETWNDTAAPVSNQTTRHQTKQSNKKPQKGKPHVPSTDDAYSSHSVAELPKPGGGVESVMDAAVESATVATKKTSLEVNDDVLGGLRLRNGPQATDSSGPVELGSVLSAEEAKALVAFKKLAASIREFNARFHAQR